MHAPDTHPPTTAPVDGRSRAFVGGSTAERVLAAGLLAIVAVMSVAILVSAAAA